MSRWWWPVVAGTVLAGCALQTPVVTKTPAQRESVVGGLPASTLAKPAPAPSALPAQSAATGTRLAPPASGGAQPATSARTDATQGLISTLAPATDSTLAKAAVAEGPSILDTASTGQAPTTSLADTPITSGGTSGSGLISNAGAGAGVTQPGGGLISNSGGSLGGKGSVGQNSTAGDGPNPTASKPPAI
jgi:hypothetical protein